MKYFTACVVKQHLYIYKMDVNKNYIWNETSRMRVLIITFLELTFFWFTLLGKV